MCAICFKSVQNPGVPIGPCYHTFRDTCLRQFCIHVPCTECRGIITVSYLSRRQQVPIQPFQLQCGDISGPRRPHSDRAISTAVPTGWVRHYYGDRQRENFRVNPSHPDRPWVKVLTYVQTLYGEPVLKNVFDG